MRTEGPTTVGLTGGVAAGKSEVARLLSAHGARVVDADTVAREVVAPGTPGYAEVVAQFGPDVVAPGGGLDRAALGRLVFADEAARRRLEAIVHPRVAAAWDDAVEAAAPGSVLVHDIPLLVENDLASRYDVVVVVDVPVEVQVDRLVRLRGMTRADALARIEAQATRDRRLEAAAVVIDNTGSPEALAARVEQVWRLLAAR